MRTRLLGEGDPGDLGDDILDELEGEALLIVEQPESHAAAAVSMAHATLEMIERLRRRGASGKVPKPA